MTDQPRPWPNHPKTTSEWRRAQADRDAESLTILANRLLYREGVAIGDGQMITDVVAWVAPGWDYVDATAIGDDRPRVVLTTFDPEQQ